MRRTEAKSLLIMLAAIAIWICRPVLFLGAQDSSELLARTAALRKMDERALENLVPLQSGLRYVGCANCNSGHQEGQLTWTLDRPDEVYCRYCGHRYPSAQYPMTEAVTVRTPRGGTASFEYWADEKGYRYFFKARRDDEVRMFLADGALNLARLYVATGDRTDARRSAVIIDRFAQVFPSWCYHYDYPFQQKEIYDGDVSPSEFRSGYRTSRWNWWAYSDVPDNLVRAFDLIRPSGVLTELSKERGVDVEARIRNDLLRNAGEQVFANPEPYTNMSPTAWRSLVGLGKVINEPRYVHDVVRRLKKFVQMQFFYDGAWYEGAPSYGSQTVSGLDQVLSELRGYSDPVGYVDTIDGQRLENLDLEREFPALVQARQVLQKMRFPSGRSVPLNDTWATSTRGSTRRRNSSRRNEPESIPSNLKSYLLPALGHACLNFGGDSQATQFHLSWSGGYGHQHADGLNITLFARGREMLSDLGYTHTAYRAWAMSTVAHNTVVVDGLSQAMGSLASPSDGNLRFVDFRNPAIQVVSVDADRVYPQTADVFRRSLVGIDAGQGHAYLVDLFQVSGGRTHDYFLHGDADSQTAARATNLSFDHLDTLLPSGFEWKPTVNEGQTRRAIEPYYPYGYLRNLSSTTPLAGKPFEIRFVSNSASEPWLQLFSIPEPSSQLVIGTNPSIRQAQEDDAQLEKFQRPFIMLRHVAENGQSTFASVIEPYAGDPVIRSVEKIASAHADLVVKVSHGDRTDHILFNASQQVAVAGAGNDSEYHFQGTLGVLRLRGNQVEFAYSLGEGGWEGIGVRIESNGPGRAKLMAVEPGKIVIEHSGQILPVASDVIRLMTSDGWTYPFQVQAVETKKGIAIIHVAEGPGMEYHLDSKRLRIIVFPQREHTGDVTVEWLTSQWMSNLRP